MNNWLMSFMPIVVNLHLIFGLNFRVVGDNMLFGEGAPGRSIDIIKIIAVIEIPCLNREVVSL